MGLTHDSDPSYVLALAATFLALCPTIAAARIYTRVYLGPKRNMGTDDWLILPATALTIGCAAVIISGVRLHAFAYATPKGNSGTLSYDLVQKLGFAFFLMQIPAIGTIKLSFVFFYRRMFCGGSSTSKFNAVSAIVAILITCWTITFWFWWLFLCHPFPARWSTPKAHATGCPTFLTWNLGFAISDFLTDLIVLALPIPMVLRLHMRTSRKIIVLAIFGLGAVALVTSTIRVAIWVQDSRIAAGIITDSHADSDLNFTSGVYWSMLETGLSLIVCCLPTLNALLSLPNLRSVVISRRSLASLDSNNGGPQAAGHDARKLDSTFGQRRDDLQLHSLDEYSSGQKTPGRSDQDSMPRRSREDIPAEHRSEQKTDSAV